MTHAVAAVVCGAAGLASGVLVVPLIRSVPPVEVYPDGEGPAALVDVAALADRPGLAMRAVIASGVAAALLGLGLGWHWSLLVLVPLVPGSVALAVIDWRTRILPSRLILPAYPLLAAAVLASWLLAGRPDGVAALQRSAIGTLAALGFFYLMWRVHPRGLGFGDVRLSGLLGMALGSLGWAQLVIGMYAGFLLGGVIGGVLALARLVDRRGYPFGPFMLAGALLGVLVGEPLSSLLVGSR